MEYDFVLLDGVGVRHRGREVDVGHPRQRCVLAILAVEPNRGVPAEDLIDKLWGERPPPSARATLRSYLSRLRTALTRPERGSLLLRRGCGYVLAVDADQVDLGRFRRAVGTARAMTSSADAAAALEDVMRSWPGVALAGLDTPWADQMRTVLARERWEANLVLYEAMVRAGREREAVLALTEAALLNPLDERVAALLLRALCSDGRQAEALERFEDFRRLLRDELGASPGAELQALHRQMLDGTVELPRDRVTPKQLPAEALRRWVSYYVHASAEADKALRPRPPVLEIDASVARPQMLPAAVTEAPMRWFDCEYGSVRAALDLAENHQWHHHVYHLARSLDSYHRRRGMVWPRLCVWTQALGAARSLEFAWGAAHAHRALADACARVGDFEDALRHMDFAMDLARRHSLGDVMAEAHYDLAVICEKRGDYDAALVHATRYLRTHQGADDMRSQAKGNSLAGWLHIHLGDVVTAQHHCEVALARNVRLGDREGIAQVLESLGVLAHMSGEDAQACEHFTASLGILVDEVDDAYHAADVHERLGDACARLHPQVAREHWRRAHVLFRDQHRVECAQRVERKLT